MRLWSEHSAAEEAVPVLPSTLEAQGKSLSQSDLRESLWIHRVFPYEFMGFLMMMMDQNFYDFIYIYDVLTMMIKLQ